MTPKYLKSSFKSVSCASSDKLVTLTVHWSSKGREGGRKEGEGGRERGREGGRREGGGREEEGGRGRKGETEKGHNLTISFQHILTISVHASAHRLPPSGPLSPPLIGGHIFSAPSSPSSGHYCS